METIQHADGRVELQSEALREIEKSPLYNEDLAPVPIEKRNWTTYNYAALWISMAHCIPTYMMASGLISAGMNWWQALMTILLGNVIVLAPILLNSHPGTKYGIPFPVDAGDCRVRLVRHSGVDRRAGDSYFFRFDTSEF
jgi:nucleobase:cation symporter-1, NCS1 family